MLPLAKRTGRLTRIYRRDFQIAFKFISYSTFIFSSSWNASPPSVVPANSDNPVAVPLKNELCVDNNHGCGRCSYDRRHRGDAQEPDLVHLVGSRERVGGN